LVWDSRRIGDGMHQLAVRATDAVGGTGDSAPVVVWVQNKGDCGCSSYGGGWETLGLLGLLAALRRRERKK
jgi:MYXO-CTERM domain-containing protein